MIIGCLSASDGSANYGRKKRLKRSRFFSGIVEKELFQVEKILLCVFI